MRWARRSGRSDFWRKGIFLRAVPNVLFHLGYDNDRGGICSFLRALAPAAAPHFEMTLGMNEGAGVSPATAASRISIAHFPAIDGETISPRTILRARVVARAARAWLREDQRRIFHGCSRAGLLVALWLARWGERRVVATVHCYGRRRWFYRYAARTLAPGGRLFFLSPEMSRYYGLPAQTWDECLPPCISLPVKARAECPRPREIRAAGIGALVRWKRWDLVLDALAQLPAELRARWRFTHIGATDGSAASARYGRELSERTRALGLEKQVVWLGQQPTSEALLGGSDVLLVPSDHEPFSLARLEALAAGVPSVSADSGGARDLIAKTPPANGWLFRNGDAGDLARVLEKISAPGAIEAMPVDHGTPRRFSAENSALRHARVYAGLPEYP